MIKVEICTMCLDHGKITFVRGLNLRQQHELRIVVDIEKVTCKMQVGISPEFEDVEMVRSLCKEHEELLKNILTCLEKGE